MRAKLDEKTVLGLPFAENGQQLYLDTKIPGFGLLVGKRTKTFFIQRTRHAKTIRHTIGRHGDFTCAMAREIALDKARDMQKGINPNEEKRKQIRNRLPTLNELRESHEQSLTAKKKKAAIKEYPEILRRHVPDWLGKSIDKISAEMIVLRHQKITNDAGPAVANKVFRILRSLYNYHAIDDANFANPVYVLNRKKLWNKETNRSNVIRQGQLEPWLSKLELVPNDVIKDCLLFILLNGLRKSEALRLSWDQVDFDQRQFKIPETKNGRPLVLPITPATETLLRNRFSKNPDRWVFPSDQSKSGHLESVRHALKTLNQEAKTDISAHDLRRTFATIANKLGISPYTLKRLINHSTKNDVTSIYVTHDLDDLREALIKISDYILRT